MFRPILVEKYFCHISLWSVKYLEIQHRKNIFILCKYCSTNINKSSYIENDLESEDMMYKIDDYNAITDGDPEKLKILKKCQLMLHLRASQGKFVPHNLNVDQWKKLISSKSNKQGYKFLKFFYITELHDKAKEEKRVKDSIFFENRKSVKESSPPLTTNSSIRYGLGYNTIFQILTEPKMNKFYNYKLMQAMIFGSQLIIDLGFDKCMKDSEIRRLCKDLLSMWNRNRKSFDPFHLIFCNVKNEDNKIVKCLCSLYPDITYIDSPFTFTNKSFIELFPKYKLIYLTPHCSSKLFNYDKNSVYILGGVHTFANESFSAAEAKKHELRMAKFPFKNNYTLSLNQCVFVLDNLKNKTPWKNVAKALHHTYRNKRFITVS